MTTTEQITIERVVPGTLDDVWALWTTRGGIESWWGPEGFTVTVRSLDLRVGGECRYVMAATGEEQRAFMAAAGMAPATEASLVYTEVDPPRRLAYRHRADFIPGVEPYDVAHAVDLAEHPDGVLVVLRFAPMHDPEWTERARRGWESELGRLAAVAAGARTG